MDELQNIGVATCELDLFLGHLRDGLGGTEKDVEPNSTGVECLSRNEDSETGNNESEHTGSCDTNAMCFLYSVTLSSLIG